MPLTSHCSDPTRPVYLRAKRSRNHAARSPRNTRYKLKFEAEREPGIGVSNPRSDGMKAEAFPGFVIRVFSRFSRATES